MAVVYIGMGSNISPRRKYLKEAVTCLQKEEHIVVKKVSRFYESKPQDAPGPDYLNAAVKLETALEPEELLDVLQKIENDLGRKRPFKNAPRTIDLDILLYGDRAVNSPGLTIPHPRMFERAFVMKPLLEIEPDFKNVYHC